MSNLPNRTPISFLQEYCAKKALTPVYNVLSNEGPIHEPVYVVQCSVGDYKATAKGASKKKAKHLASYLILIKMFQNQEIIERECTTLQELYLGACSTLGANFLETIEGSDLIHNAVGNLVETEENHVGNLQDLCNKRLWPPPTYEIVKESPSSGLTRFVCTINLWKWTRQGFGLSKKAAKKNAASIMIEEIVNNNLNIPKEELDAMDESCLPVVKKEDCDKMEENKEESEDITTKLIRKALSGLWNLKNQRIEPMNIDLNQTLKYSSLLESILPTINVSSLYTYNFVSKKSNENSELIICMLQLSTKPAQVLVSQSCKTIEEARNSAAKRAILYLNTMTHKYPKIDYTDWFES